MSAASDLAQTSWQAFSRLLDEALELPPTERLAWLEALGKEHDVVKPALRAVLARASGVETAQWLATLPREATLPPSDESDLKLGAVVGTYRLIRELGVGGMGTVWLAERADGTLKRQVALKLPRASWSRGLAERMARERDILAALEHPNIARLYDAGTDAQGRPYLALEYVEGQPIDVYCRERELPIRERVGLMLQVARAVAFAHSRLVVHRDLKPSNILVTADGQVRLLDFGIAKLMEGDRAAETQLTQLAGRALTPDYASPEQIRGEPIGTASDAYSLGVVAFELLAGARPYKLKRGSAAEVEEAVLAADVPLASSVATDTVTRRALRGDLDAILGQALRKDVKRRYATVEALADDLGRHLDGLPVAARPDSRAYRLRKFVGRNRLAVSAGVSVALALAVGAGVSVWQASVARHQARLAQVESQTAAAVQDFLEGIFKTNAGSQADPLAARQRTALQLLDEGAKRIDASLDDSPRAKLRVLLTLATIFDDLGETERMADMLAKRVQVLEQLLPSEQSDLAQACAELAMALAVIGRDMQAQENLRRAEQILSRLPAASDDAHIAVDMAIAQFHAARGDPRGLAAARRLTQRLQSMPLSINQSGALMLRGKLERFAGNPAQAVKTLHEGIRLARQLAGGGENTLFVLLTELALALADAGQPEAAEKNMREALRVVEGNAGPSSPMAIIILARLGQLLTEQGRADAALHPLLEARRRVDASPALAAVPGVVAPQRYHEGQARRRLGQLDAAARCYAEALALVSAPDGSADAAIRAGAGLSLTLAMQGKLAQAEEAIEKARAIQQKADLRGFSQSLMLAEAQAAILLAKGELKALGPLWRSLESEPLFAARLGEPGAQVLKVLATFAERGAETAAAEAKEALQRFATGPAVPNRDYEAIKLRNILAKQLTAR